MLGATEAGKSTYVGRVAGLSGRAFDIGPVTERIIVNPETPGLCPSTTVHLPIARFLKDLLEHQPNASIRVLLTGVGAAAPYRREGKLSGNDPHGQN